MENTTLEHEEAFNTRDAIRLALISSIDNLKALDDDLPEDRKPLLEKQELLYERLSANKAVWDSIRERVFEFFDTNVQKNTFHSGEESFEIFEVEDPEIFRDNLIRLIRDIKVGV
jgi:hypothetical protein